MNVIFFAIVALAFLAAAYGQLTTSAADSAEAPMQAVSKAIVDAASGAVELAIGLVGVMALFLGLMKIAEEGGLLTILARLIRPVMVRLFPAVPPDHPAMGAMILNLSANALGLGNAATPFGIRAMEQLDRLNPQPGTATNAMALFLAINTSSVTLLPTGVIALRASAGSADPAAILPSTLVATCTATMVAVAAATLYCRLFPVGPPPPGQQPESRPWVEACSDDDGPEDAPAAAAASHGYPGWVTALAFAGFLALIPLAVRYGEVASPWIIPSLVLGFLMFGLVRGVRIYEVFVEGAREGFQVALRIIPYLVAILVAVGMFRASGALAAMVEAVGPWTAPLGLPPEALPMALLRPLSGSGAYGVMASIIEDPATGPDTYVGMLVTTLQGSTETTFYVLAVYFGAVRVRRIRHTLAAALTADIAGVAAAVTICLWLFG